MSINHLNIKLAFRKVLRAIPTGVTGQPDVPMGYVQWEGEELEPPEDANWLAETYLLVDEGRVATDLDGASGIYQVNVFGPMGKGQTTIEKIAQRIKDAFPSASSIADTGLGVEIAIDKSQRGTAAMEGGASSPRNNNRWLMIPVTVNWRSYAAV